MDDGVGDGCGGGLVDEEAHYTCGQGEGGSMDEESHDTCEGEGGEGGRSMDGAATDTSRL